jgi:hypothetical protein
LDHFLDLFHGEKLSGHFHGSIHHQGRSHHHPVAADGFDILDLNDLRFNAEFFDRLLGSILELIALGSTHSQDFDFFHFSSPFGLISISVCCFSCGWMADPDLNFWKLLIFAFPFAI